MNPRVLCVDFDPAMRQFYEQVLADCGCEVELASTGEALRLLNPDSLPDLVICELDMPHTPVLQLLGSIPHLGGEDGVAVIIVTRCDSDELESAARRRGVRDYLVKPVSARRLVAAVGQVFDVAPTTRAAAAEASDLIAGRFELRSTLEARDDVALYRAVDMGDGNIRQVLLKVWSAPADNQAIEAFLSAVSTMQQLQLPGLVTPFAAGQLTEKLLYAAFEWIDGESLLKILEGYGELPESQAEYIGFEILRTLREVHDVGLVHGRIDPSHVMVTEDGDVKLLAPDLGAMLHGRPAQPQTWAAACCLAPEALRKPHQPPTAAGDIYAAGAMLYLCLQAEQIFRGTIAEIAASRRASVYPPLKKEPRFNPHLSRLIDSMMCFLPLGRPPAVSLQVDFGTIMLDETTANGMHEETISEKVPRAQHQPVAAEQTE